MKELTFEVLWSQAERKLADKKLAIVCNTKKSHVTSDTNNPFSMDTEYFSDDEFEQIVSLFSSANLDMVFFTYEDDFLCYVIEQEPSNLLVYNAAQSGTGPGRKSLVPAFCNLHGIPCTGSNAYVVSLCRQKYHVNQILSKAGLPVPRTWLYSDGWVLDNKPSLNTKILIKPIYESASIGIDKSSVQSYFASLDQQIHLRMLQHKQPMIAQEFISGYEVEVPLVLVNDSVIQLPPVGISINGIADLQDQILDYERIYFDRYGFYDYTDKHPVIAEQLCDCAKKAAWTIGMQGLCRVDFRIKPDGTYYITDVSTNPHFVAHSSVNQAFHMAGLSPNDIAKTILSAAVTDLFEINAHHSDQN